MKAASRSSKPGMPGVGGRPIRERDEGRSTRAMAIGIVLECTTCRHFSLAFHIAAGATAHTA